MVLVWSSSPHDRLIIWRDFRDNISTLPKDQAILNTAKYWSTAPIASQYLSMDLIRDWPDPWTLIHDNYYDDISITLGMVYTLALANDQFDDFEIQMLVNNSTGEVFHTAWFENGRYIVNYEYGEVVTLDEIHRDLTARYKYSYADLKIDNYK